MACIIVRWNVSQITPSSSSLTVNTTGSECQYQCSRGTPYGCQEMMQCASGSWSANGVSGSLGYTPHKHHHRTRPRHRPHKHHTTTRRDTPPSPTPRRNTTHWLLLTNTTAQHNTTHTNTDPYNAAHYQHNYQSTTPTQHPHEHHDTTQHSTFTITTTHRHHNTPHMPHKLSYRLYGTIQCYHVLSLA